MTRFDDDAADEELIRNLRYSTFRDSRSRLSVSVVSGVSGRREASEAGKIPCAIRRANYDDLGRLNLKAANV
jgi:hypothetical protein